MAWFYSKESKGKWYFPDLDQYWYMYPQTDWTADKAGAYALTRLNNLLRDTAGKVGIEWEQGSVRPTLRLHGGGVLGLMAWQIVSRVTAARPFGVCTWCGTVYDRKRWPSPSQDNFCPDHKGKRSTLSERRRARQ